MDAASTGNPRVAEADGNRTHQRQELPLNGFEDRAAHQDEYASDMDLSSPSRGLMSPRSRGGRRVGSCALMGRLRRWHRGGHREDSGSARRRHRMARRPHATRATSDVRRGNSRLTQQDAGRVDRAPTAAAAPGRPGATACHCRTDHVAAPTRRHGCRPGSPDAWRLRLLDICARSGAALVVVVRYCHRPHGLHRPRRADDRNGWTPSKAGRRAAKRSLTGSRR